MLNLKSVDKGLRSVLFIFFITMHDGWLLCILLPEAQLRFSSGVGVNAKWRRFTL